MTAPFAIARSFPGAAVETVLSSPIAGANDPTFSVAQTTGWTDIETGNALGVDGPFTVLVDAGLGSAEKILCSAINLSTGLVTVYNANGYFGRGHEKTTAQAHSANQGTVVCIQGATEAKEANFAVTRALSNNFGNVTSLVPGDTNSNGTSVLEARADHTHAIVVPAGRAFPTTVVSLPSGAFTQIPLTAEAGSLKGGLTLVNNGFVVPGPSPNYDGLYYVSGQLYFNGSSGSQRICSIYKNGSVIRQTNRSPFGNVNDPDAVACNSLLQLVAGDVIQLYGYQDSGAGLAILNDPGTTFHWLAMHLVSR